MNKFLQFNRVILIQYWIGAPFISRDYSFTRLCSSRH